MFFYVIFVYTILLIVLRTKKESWVTFILKIKINIDKSNGVFRNSDNLTTPFLISGYQNFIKIIKKGLKKP